MTPIYQHLRIYYENGSRQTAEGNGREPVGTLVSITSAHQRVNDRVVIAQIRRISLSRTRWPCVRIAGSQLGDSKVLAFVFSHDQPEET